MNHLLAIDTSTDALSLALWTAQGVRSVHRVMPRQHQQTLFAFLDELLEGRRVAELGLGGVVFGRGPGSFTGLRIAASAAQGIGFSLQIPVIGVSSLETQARSYLRLESPAAPRHIVSTIDARIGQLYAQAFYCDGAELQPLGDTVVCEPTALSAAALGLPAEATCVAIGSGCPLLRESDFATALPIDACFDAVLPEARDMFEAGRRLLRVGDAGDPAAALPDYVQKRIGWKTLAEQGKRA